MIWKWLIICTLFLAGVAAGSAAESVGMWSGIGGEADGYAEMMERAVFMDVPRRDLLNVVRGYAVEPSRGAARQKAARACYWRAWVLLKEDADSAHILTERAMQLCDSAAYPYDHLRFSLMRGDLLRMRGSFADAYAIYRDKIRLLRRFGDIFWEGKVLVAIGALMQELEEYHEAMRNFREGEALFLRAGSDVCATKNRINIANLQYLLGEKTAALRTIDGIGGNAFVQSDSVYFANVLVSRFRISDCRDSLSVLRALDISRVLSNDPLSVLAMVSVGMLRNLQGNPAACVEVLDSALSIADRIDDLPNIHRILEGLEEAHRKLGHTSVADTLHSRWREISDTLYHHERNDRIRRAEHLATINRYELRMAEEAQSSRWRLTLILSVGGALLLILCLSLWLMWMWRRRTESERRLKAEENERLLLLNRQYGLEIEAKEKELASNTLLMAQKNTQLKELAEQVERMERQGMDREHGGELRETISRQLTADDDWRYFKLRFEKVHPDFFTVMKERFPSLSKTELRLCAYIRVGMTAKEIAQVLSVKPDTVNTSRYRIRKKMQLSPDESLESTLESAG